MKWQPSIPLILLVPLSARGEYYLSVLNLPRAGVGETILFILLCFALVFSAVLFEVVKVRRERLADRAVAEQRFAENARRYSLDAEERRLMLRMGRYAKSGDANDMFESVIVYEQCVEGEAADAIAAAKDEAELQEIEELLQSVRKKLHYTIVDPGQPLVSTRNISSGQAVWILGPRKTILGEGVVSIVRELSFSVKLSLKDFGRTPAFESTVRMAFTRRADAIYGIEAPLVSFDPSSGLVVCRHTPILKRNQLRQDVRVETDLTISVRRLESEAPARHAPLDLTPFLVKMTDISGGGFAFVTERKLAQGDLLAVTATSSKLTLAGVKAKIVALSQNKASKRYLYHAKYVNIDFERREKIIKYVFTRLRELTQR